MKGFVFVLCLLFYNTLHAQRTVQTIVPLQPVPVGAAFQVQYIVAAGEQVTELQSPAFGKDFRFVSGPRLYRGEALINNIKTPIQNFSYTLIPLRKGRLIVRGATALFGAAKIKSADTFLEVTDKMADAPLSSTPLTGLPRLAPGAAWNAKLHNQLFIKTTVSRQSGFVGEPVVATFTLFSRLPCASEVLKNPGFYGFSVLDLPNAADGTQTVQTYNGAFYNTHILRRVQLYPAQAGRLLIDKMSVNNAIEYSDSMSGVPVQTTVVLESEPLPVVVKPLPVTAAQNFAGAVGTFFITAYLEKRTWRQNSTGKLNITISGKGNFLQLTAPDIAWPPGLDVFEPTVTERLQKDAVPIAGTRTYTYTFITDSIGAYAIPAIAFTYFDPAAKQYKTATTNALPFTVLKAKHTLLPQAIRIKLSQPRSYIWWLIPILFIPAAFAIYKQRFKKNTSSATTESRTPDFEKTVQQISDSDTDKYRQLQQALMGFLKSSPEEPRKLQQVAFENISAAPKNNLQLILEECEAVQYYNAAPTIPFSELQQRALLFMQSAKS